MNDILNRYWSLTGAALLPSSFGVWMSRCMYRDAEQVRNVVERMRALGIPLDAVNVDPRWLEARKHHERDGCDFVWDEAAFGTTEEFAGWLNEHGVRLCLWENPYVWKDTELYEEGVARYFAKAADGSPAPALRTARGRVVDFTNPTRRVAAGPASTALRAGVSAFKSDYGEGVPTEARFSDGTTGRETHNVHPLLYNRAVFDVIKEERGEAIVFGRSGYAGSQRYPINWVGDTQCTWEGMAALRAGLSLSLGIVLEPRHRWLLNCRTGQGRPRAVHPLAQCGRSSHSRFHGGAGASRGTAGRGRWFVSSPGCAIGWCRTAVVANEGRNGVPPCGRCCSSPDDPTTHRRHTVHARAVAGGAGSRRAAGRRYLLPGHWQDFPARLDGPRWLDLNASTRSRSVRDDRFPMP
jgi:alpha-D-xyloside xylohydrolase